VIKVLLLGSDGSGEQYYVYEGVRYRTTYDNLEDARSHVSNCTKLSSYALGSHPNYYMHGYSYTSTADWYSFYYTK